MVDIDSIPSTIANLLNLKTLIVRSASSISLPDTIWNLKKLRHLYINGLFGFQWPIRNLDNSSNLCNLISFSRAILPAAEDLDKLFKKCPNIRNMKCTISYYLSPSWSESPTVLGLDFLNQLESLNLDIYGSGNPRGQIEFQFSPSLRKLTLSEFHLTRSRMQAIANLPNLEALKLLSAGFERDIWSLEEKEFSNLRFLKLSSVGIAKWTAEDCFPRLEKLVLRHCVNLKEIPLSLGNIYSLKMIEVSYCNHSVATSIEQVREEHQFSMGADDLEILISSYGSDAS